MLELIEDAKQKSLLLAVFGPGKSSSLKVLFEALKEKPMTAKAARSTRTAPWTSRSPEGNLKRKRRIALISH